MPATLHIFLMPAAILLFTAGISVAMFMRKSPNWLRRHKTVNLAGWLLLLTGGTLAVVSVVTGGGAHLGGLHQQIGALAIILSALTVFLGFYAFTAADKKSVRAIHRWSGRVTFLVAAAALILGLMLIGIL